jgi:hypothetical protein
MGPYCIANAVCKVRPVLAQILHGPIQELARRELALQRIQRAVHVGTDLIALALEP